MKRRFLTLVVFGLCWLCHYASAQADALYPIWENGLYGYMDASGSPAIAAQWESVSSFVHGYALVRDGMEYAVVDQEGRVVAGPRLAQDRREYAINLRSISFGDAVFDCLTGRLLSCPDDFDGQPYDAYADESAHLLLVVGDDRYGYLDRQTGEWAIPPVFDTMSQDWLFGSDLFKLSHETSRAQFQNGYAVVGKDGHCYLINENNEPVPMQEDLRPVSQVVDGCFAVIDGQQRRGIADIEGNVRFLSDRYKEIRLQEGGVAVAFLPAPDHLCDLVTFLNLYGIELMKPVAFFAYERNIPRLQENHFIQSEDVTVGSALYSLAEGRLWYDDTLRIFWFDVAHDLLIAYAGEQPGDAWEDACNTLRRLDDTVLLEGCDFPMGFAPDLPGWENPPDLVRVQAGAVQRGAYFSEGLQAAAIRLETGQLRYGYVNLDGEFAIAPTFLAAGNFLNGLALVATNEGLAYIDRNGRLVWESEPMF